MPLKNLSNAEMLLLTRVTLEEHRAAFDAGGQTVVLRALEALLPDLEAIQARPGHDADGALAAEGAALDGEHDRLLRGLHTWLEVLETLLDAERAAEVARLRGRLFPDGLPMLQRTYTEEAANARAAAGRLDDADRALLRAATLPDGRTAHDVCEAWLRAGAALEQFERRRLAASDDASDRAVRQFEVRNRWIRVIRALEGLVALAGATSHPLLDAVRIAEARADQRVGRSGGSTAPAEPQPLDA
jgi:hypothetical protein